MMTRITDCFALVGCIAADCMFLEVCRGQISPIYQNPSTNVTVKGLVTDDLDSYIVLPSLVALPRILDVPGSVSRSNQIH